MSAHGEAVAAPGEAIGRPTSSRRAKDLAFRLGLLTCLALAIILLGVLLWDVAADGIDRLSWDFITSFASINADQAGIEAALTGTLWLMAVCAAFIIPVGVATAIYLEEYADNTKWYRPRSEKARWLSGPPNGRPSGDRSCPPPSRASRLA
jgi:phosphate transport system permease protein